MSYESERIIELLRDRPDGIDAEHLAIELGVEAESVSGHVSKARASLQDSDMFIPWLTTGKNADRRYRMTNQLNAQDMRAKNRWITTGLTLVIRGAHMVRTHVRAHGRGDIEHVETLNNIEVLARQLRYEMTR